MTSPPPNKSEGSHRGSYPFDYYNGWFIRREGDHFFYCGDKPVDLAIAQSTADTLDPTHHSTRFKDYTKKRYILTEKPEITEYIHNRKMRDVALEKKQITPSRYPTLADCYPTEEDLKADVKPLTELEGVAGEVYTIYGDTKDVLPVLRPDGNFNVFIGDHAILDDLREELMKRFHKDHFDEDWAIVRQTLLGYHAFVHMTKTVKNILPEIRAGTNKQKTSRHHPYSTEVKCQPRFEWLDKPSEWTTPLTFEQRLKQWKPNPLQENALGKISDSCLVLLEQEEVLALQKKMGKEEVRVTLLPERHSVYLNTIKDDASITLLDFKHMRDANFTKMQDVEFFCNLLNHELKACVRLGELYAVAR